MKIKYLAKLAAGFLMLSSGTVGANLINVPMELSSWALVSYGSNNHWEQATDGIRFYGSGYRNGGGVISNLTTDFSNSTTYIKWEVNGGSGRYMGTSPAIGDFNNIFNVGANYTTDHSFNGSILLPQNTWIYTQIDIHSNITRMVTALNNYADNGGSVIADTQRSWVPFQVTTIPNGHIVISLWDNYGGTSAWALVNEVKYETSQTPIPAAIWLVGSALVGLGGFFHRKTV